MPNPDVYLRTSPSRLFAIPGNRNAYLRFKISAPPPFNGRYAPMAAEYKQGVAARLPVDLSDSGGSAQAGVVFGSVTATLEYADGTTTDISPADGAHWVEPSAGTFVGSGTYNLIVDSGKINQPGVFIYRVKTASSSFKAYGKIIATENADISGQLVKALGMLHENAVLDQTSYDAFNNLTNGRLRLYDSKANALGAGVTGLLHTYSVLATYIGQNMQTYTVVLES